MNKIFFILLILSLHLTAFAETFTCDGITATTDIASEALEKFYTSDKNIIFTNDEEFITKTEVLALKLYSGSEYVHINKRLRSETMDDEFYAFTLILCSALNKKPSFEGTVYRVAKLSKDIQSQYIEGEIVTEKAFTSSSQTKSGIKNFIGVQKMNTYFTIKSLTGKDISQESGRPEEKEILFPAGTQFMVKKVKKSFFGDDLNIWLEEIP